MTSGSEVSLFLDTRNATFPLTPHDASWNLSNQNWPKTAAYLDLFQMSFYNPFSSIMKGVNDSIVLQSWDGASNSATTTYTIPAGQYTITQFITELNTLFAATIPTHWVSGLTVATSSGYNTFLLTFSQSGNGAGSGFQFLTSTTASEPLGIQNQMFAALTGNYPSVSSLVATSMVNLAGTLCLNVMSDSFKQHSYASNGSTNTLACVLVDSNFGDQHVFQATEPRWQFVSNLQHLRNIHLFLQDDDQNVATFPPYNHIIYTFRIKFAV